jgi:transcriptional regulator with XRE-family HTH domain
MEILSSDKVFAENLKKIRKSMRLTQEQMAKKLHINKQSIFRYEKGEASPGLNIIQKLSRYFNVNLNWLLNEKCASEEMFLKEKPMAQGEFIEELNELVFLLDHVPFVRAAILRHFVLYKFENRMEIKKFLEENGLSQ